MRLKPFSFSLLLFISVNPDLFANERLGPSTLEELGRDRTQERAFFVPGSSVAYANYYALKRDFPALKSLTNSAIDEWILRNNAWRSYRTGDHSDGLMSLGEAIAEVTRQTAVQMLFDLYNSENATSRDRRGRGY